MQSLILPKIDRRYSGRSSSAIAGPMYSANRHGSSSAVLVLSYMGISSLNVPL